MKTSTLASMLVLFAIMLAHALLETARDALFIAKLGADRLALAYIAIAVVALAAMTIVRRCSGTRDPRRLLVGFLTFAAVGTSILAATLAFEPSLAFVLYVWAGLVATLVVPTFWLVVERSLRIGEAKRAFGAVAAGGSVGALLGSALAALLGTFFGASALVVAAAFALVLASIAAVTLAPRTEAKPVEPALEDEAAPRRPARDARYVRLLLLLGLVSTVTLTLGDLLFKRLLAERLASDDLASVFGAVYTGLNVIGLVVQLAVTARLLDRAGVGAALTVLPAIMLVSALGFVATGITIAVIALKLADGGLRHSVHRVATEILFLPLATATRDAAKPLVDMVGQRGGQALAALIAMTLASSTHVLGVVTVAGTIAWLVVVGFIRGAYLRQFRATLEARDIQRDVQLPMLDKVSVELLMASLASPNEAEAGGALDLLVSRKEPIPALVLYHPSSAIVRRALASLRGNLRPDVVRVLQHLTSHSDPQIRAAAIAASSRTGHQEHCLGHALADPEADVRAAAAVALFEGPHAERAQDTVATLVHGSAASRAALARAIGHDPREQFRDVLVQLLAKREPEVVREVVHVWESAPALADIQHLLRLLDHPHVRGDVRRAIVASNLLEPMLVALDDPRTPLGVRRHLPRTISRFQSREAATALVARLLREPDGTTEFKILRALGRMRADNPALLIPTEPVRRYVQRSLEDAGRYRHLRHALASGPASPTLELLVELLAEKRRHAIERAFRALGILHPDADLRSVHDAITSDDDEQRAAAREIVDEVLPAEERAPLIDELVERSHAPLEHEDAVAALLVDPSDSLRCIAAHHVAQRRLVALRPELVRLKPLTGSTFVTLAFDQAIASLDA